MSVEQSQSNTTSWTSQVNGWLLRLTCLLILAALLLGCSVAETPIEMPTASPVPSATPTATSTPIPSPTPTNTPLPTATPGPLSSAEILERVSPSVAFIELPTHSGSGFLIDNGYIVTNAHVVWPFEKARVVFPDGSDFKNVPVHNWDTLSDLAIVGPIETEIDPLSLDDGDEQVVGSDIYLIGYPGEVDDFPQPTIARGLISRMREWEPAEMTYYQVDARIGGGQSGGVLVSDRAEVIGVANFLFDDSGFGLAASAADVKPRLEKLLAAKDEFALDNRRVPLAGGQKNHNLVILDNEWHMQTYVLNEPSNTEIELEVDGGDNDIAFIITDAMGGFVDFVDQAYSDIEHYRFTTALEAPYFVSVFQYSPDAGHFSIEADHNLVHYQDFDDHRGVLPGSSLEACIDYPGDLDYFLLTLKEGERVNILVDSIMIDPHLTLSTLGAFTEDDDTGGGLFGLNAELTFIAADPGTYTLAVSDSWGSNSGCYTLFVREPYEGAPTPVTLEPVAETVFTDFGEMWPYESSSSPFSMNVPAEWNASPASFGDMAAFCDMAELCLAGDALFAIAVEDLGILGDITQEEYVKIYRDMVENFGLRVIDIRPFETRTGLQGTILQLSFGELFKAYRFVYVHENMAFNTTYILPADQEEALRPLIEYTFSTIAVVE